MTNLNGDETTVMGGILAGTIRNRRNEKEERINYYDDEHEIEVRHDSEIAGLIKYLEYKMNGTFGEHKWKVTIEKVRK